MVGQPILCPRIKLEVCHGLGGLKGWPSVAEKDAPQAAVSLWRCIHESAPTGTPVSIHSRGHQPAVSTRIAGRRATLHAGIGASQQPLAHANRIGQVAAISDRFRPFARYRGCLSADATGGPAIRRARRLLRPLRIASGTCAQADALGLDGERDLRDRCHCCQLAGNGRRTPGPRLVASTSAYMLLQRRTHRLDHGSRAIRLEPATHDLDTSPHQEQPAERLFVWPCCRRHLFAIFRRIIEAAGVRYSPRHSLGLFHRLRRTALTYCWAVDPAVAQRQGGHSSAEITRKHYVDPRIAADGICAADILPPIRLPSLFGFWLCCSVPIPETVSGPPRQCRFRKVLHLAYSGWFESSKRHSRLPGGWSAGGKTGLSHGVPGPGLARLLFALAKGVWLCLPS